MATLVSSEMLFHQDNALVHTSIVTMAKIKGLKVELLLHIIYLPDLAPQRLLSIL